LHILSWYERDIIEFESKWATRTILETIAAEYLPLRGIKKGEFNPRPGISRGIELILISQRLLPGTVREKV